MTFPHPASLWSLFRCLVFLWPRLFTMIYLKFSACVKLYTVSCGFWWFWNSLDAYNWTFCLGRWGFYVLLELVCQTHNNPSISWIFRFKFLTIVIGDINCALWVFFFLLLLVFALFITWYAKSIIALALRWVVPAFKI